MRALVICGLAALVAVVVGAGPARANDGPKPAGQWLLKFYSDPDLERTNSSEVCFKPNGTWFALDFPIAGNWFLLGDRLRFMGIYQFGAFAAFGGFTSGNVVGAEFNDTDASTGLPFGNGNILLTRTAKSCQAQSPMRKTAPGRAYSG